MQVFESVTTVDPSGDSGRFVVRVPDDWTLVEIEANMPELLRENLKDVVRTDVPMCYNLLPAREALSGQMICVFDWKPKDAEVAESRL